MDQNRIKKYVWNTSDELLYELKLANIMLDKWRHDLDYMLARDAIRTIDEIEYLLNQQ